LLYTILSEKYDDNKKDSNKTLKNKKHKRQKFKSKNIMTQINIRTILLLLVTLIANTYAWFIYNSMVSTKIDVHIKSWQFELEAGENSEDFVFTVEEIYPGMEPAVTTIEAMNKGEMDANLSCKITHIRILDEDFYIEPEDENDRVPGITYYTPNELLDKLLNDYPFKIQIFINGSLYDGQSEFLIPAASPKTTISYSVTWPYETGTGIANITANDEIDTEWGERAYNYYHNPSNPPAEHYCIEVNLTVIAVQNHGG
jgi:hypothetical protein